MRDARGILKGIANASTQAALAPLLAALRAEQAALGADRADAVFQAYSQALSVVPGLSGEFLRRAFYSLALPGCGADFTVGFGTVLSKQGVTVGDRVYIGMRCTIGHARLADHVTIGSNVDILSGKAQHRFDDLDAPIQDQGGEFTTVAIGENSWLGNGTIVMADIGRDCIVGAGSVVVDPLPDRVIAVGNPARVIRERR
jgi:virginiamycin A acetyltransferase